MINNLINRSYASLKDSRKLIDSAQASVAGWQLSNYAAEENLGPMVYYYVYDVPTKFFWVASIKLENAQRITKLTKNSPSQWHEIRHGLGLIVSAASGNEADAKKLSGVTASLEEQLLLMLCSYSATTKSFDIGGGVQAYDHFLTLNYRKAFDSKESRLRPVIFKAKDRGLLEFDFMKLAIDHIMAEDLKKHPEYMR